MSNITIIISLVIGILGSLFLFWRELKEDYDNNQIFSYGFIVSAFIIVGFLIGIFLKTKIPSSNIFNPAGIWFWTSFIGGVIGWVIAYFKFRFKFFETLEAGSVGFVFFIFVVNLLNSLQPVNVKAILFALFSGFLVLIFYMLDSRYKTFSWYKSGRVGFSGLAILAIFFLVRAVVALADPSMVSFVGKGDAILDSVVSFIFFLTLYNLSGI